MIAALCPALAAVPAGARDGAPGGTAAPASAASVQADGRAMLMVDARVQGGAVEVRRTLPALPARGAPSSDMLSLATLVLAEGANAAESHAMPSIPLPPAAWQVVQDPPRRSRIDATPLERMSLEGSADHRRRRNLGLDARLELRIDGREDSAMVSLGGRLAGAIRTLERR